MSYRRLGCTTYGTGEYQQGVDSIPRLVKVYRGCGAGQASIDYEEDVSAVTLSAFASQLEPLVARVDGALSTATRGRLLQTGLQVGKWSSCYVRLYGMFKDHKQQLVGAGPGHLLRWKRATSCSTLHHRNQHVFPLLMCSW
jgi:hypothetical protein